MGNDWRSVGGFIRDDLNRRTLIGVDFLRFSVLFFLAFVLGVLFGWAGAA